MGETVTGRMLISDITQAGLRQGQEETAPRSCRDHRQPPLVSPVLCPLSEATLGTLSCYIPISLHSVWPRDKQPFHFTIAELALKDNMLPVSSFNVLG